MLRTKFIQYLSRIRTQIMLHALVSDCPPFDSCTPKASSVRAYNNHRNARTLQKYHTRVHLGRACVNLLFHLRQPQMPNCERVTVQCRRKGALVHARAQSEEIRTSPSVCRVRACVRVAHFMCVYCTHSYYTYTQIYIIYNMRAARAHCERARMRTRATFHDI